MLHNFAGGASAHPQALIQASDGNLYGATLGNGGPSVIFRISTSGQYFVVQQLNLNTVGQCTCTLIQGSDGNIYGTTALYGPQGNGTVFAMEAGLPKPAPQALAFSPQQGAVGTSVRIWDYNQTASLGEIQWRRRDHGEEQWPELRLGDGSRGRHQRADHRHHAGRQQHNQRQVHGAVGLAIS